MRKHILVVMTTMVFVLALVTAAMAADPHVGTWKLNIAKSKLPSPAPKSEMVKIEAINNGLKFTFDAVDATGKSTHTESSGTFDGKEYPVSGDPTVDTSAIRRVDAQTFSAVNKKANKVVARWQVTVSKNGRTSTATSKGKDAQGQEISIIEVYDKQ